MTMSDISWPSGISRAVVFNTEAAYLYLTDDAYRRNADCATEVFCDGIGLQIYSLLRFRRLLSRRHGPDIFLDYLHERSGAHVHFLGGSEACHAALRQRFPDFFSRNHVSVDTDNVRSEADFGRKARDIANSNYDDVLIFLGLGRQEKLQRMLQAAGHGGSSIGLGAAIDFVSGTKVRAGRVWRQLGLEWLPRLVREPRMLPRVARSFAIYLLFLHDNNRALARYLLGENHRASQ